MNILFLLFQGRVIVRISSRKIQFSKGIVQCMDDDFMTVCLADNFEDVELILRIVLRREDIKIKSVRTQVPLKNL